MTEPWTEARIRAEHPIVRVRLEGQVYYGAIDATPGYWANVYIRLATTIVQQPFSWDAIVAHLTTTEPLDA